MKLRARTAIGIDISSSSAGLVVLRQDKDGIHLLRAARRPIKGGLQENLRALKRITKDLRRACKVKGMPATASLFSPCDLVQIVEIPPTISGHKGQYVQKEIRHYVTLAGVTVVSDYRDLHSSTETERMLVVAGDSECVTEAVNGCQQGGLDVDVVEPQLLAYIRALYHQRIAGRFGCNVLLALLREGKLFLVVMHERNIDFVRTQTLVDNPEDPEAVLKQLAAEIKIITQYYEIEVADSTGHWEVNVIADDENTPLPESAQTALTEALGPIPVEILTSENISTALSIDIPAGIPSDQISTVAIGHAMRALCAEIVLPKINCLPPLIKEIKEIKRSMLMTAVLAAVILLIMGLVTLVLIQRGDRMNARLLSQKSNNVMGKVAGIRGALDAEIEQVEKIPKHLKEILSSQINVNWARVLTDIKEGIPADVSIAQFDTRSDYSVFIDGVALHSKGITTFLSRLNKSDYFDSVDLVKSDYKKSGQSGLSGHHLYEIRCHLTTGVGI